jgi:hypothetical protein
VRRSVSGEARRWPPADLMKLSAWALAEALDRADRALAARGPDGAVYPMKLS